MRFIRTEELKPGMRLARPIYNKSGVLLYERNTKLTTQGIYSVKNFGLIGIYILEPAEPLPPMTEEDIEFERFQTMSMFSLRNALKLIAGGKKTDSLKQLTREIVRRFGNMNHKVNFMQNLRSPEDDVYKHSINVAILSALMSKRLQFSENEKERVVSAALIHDIGKLLISKDGSIGKETYIDHRNPEMLKKAHSIGYNLINNDYNLESSIKALVGQMIRKIDELGRIVLPISMRANLDIKPNDSIEIFADGEKIILQKYQPSCIFCDNEDNVVLFSGKRICQDCLQKIKNEI